MSLPCNQSHTRMEKRDNGYYCSSCEKVLIDFRQKSDEEVKQLISANPGKICGVFHNHQISSKVSYVALSRASYQVGLSLLGILGFLGSIISSCESAPDDATHVKQQAFNKLKFPMKISGQLREEQTGKPLAQSPVEIQQHGKTILKSKTDNNGNFELIMEEKDLKNETFELIYQSKKHVSDTLHKQQISSFASGKKLVLTLKAEAATCRVKAGELPEINGDVMIEGEIAPPELLGEPMIETTPEVTPLKPQ